MRYPLSLLLFVLTPLLSTHLVHAKPSQNPGYDHVKGQLMVTFRPSTSPSEIKSILKSHGLKIIEVIKNGSSNLYLLKTPNLNKEPDLVTALESEPAVDHAELDFILPPPKR